MRWRQRADGFPGITRDREAVITIVMLCAMESPLLRVVGLIVGKSGDVCRSSGGSISVLRLGGREEGCDVDSSLRAPPVVLDHGTVRPQADVAEPGLAVGALSRVAAAALELHRLEAAGADLVRL